MSQIIFAVLIALGLSLTTYFGVAAWQATDRTEAVGFAYKSLPP